jgi:hypothetical protein
LFSKDSIIRLTSPGKSIPKTEFDRFKVLYLNAHLDSSLEKSCVDTICKLLGMECKAKDIVSIIDPKKTPTMWEVIDQKYTNETDRKRGLGKVIAVSLKANILPTPDGPTLIYGARNWAVHGMLLTSFFRGSQQKYITFVDNITLLLSMVLEGISKDILKKLQQTPTSATKPKSLE